MKKLFLLLALCGMVAVGCTEGGVDDNIDNGGNNTEQPGEDDDDENEIPDDAYISINKDILTFSPDGESVEVKVYSNYEWTLTNNCDWVTTSISGGEASEEGTAITLTADLTYDDREGTITFSCGKAKKVLVVSQSFKEAIIADENNVFNVPAEGGNVIINYQTTVECEVIIPEEAKSWISLAPATRALVNESATLNIADNNTGAERSVVVKVVAANNSELFAEYTITQTQRYYVEYTSTDGCTITPYSSDAFGVTIIRNEYIDGKGYIEFDAPIISIGYEAFYYCTSLTSVTIPDSVTSIGDSAFSGCTSLTSVTIGDGVTSIGIGAFYECYSLTSVTIPDSVTSIGDCAFWVCTSLTSVTIGDGVTSIGGNAFVSCSGLKSFKGKYASSDGRCLIKDDKLISFAPCGLTQYTIPDSVTSIGEGAFWDCTSLTSVTIGDCVTSIGDYAFAACTSLTSITIPDSVKSIGNEAFEYCFSLTSVTIGNGVTSIGNRVFYECDSLKSVTIGDSVTSIGEYAFYNCNSLTSVTIPDSVTSIGNYAFSSCSDLKSFKGKYASSDGRCLIKDGELIGFAPCGLTQYTIPDSVTSIGGWAFCDCYWLTSVTIPDSVTSIGDSAFSYCTSLTSITIPDGVTSIGDSAFRTCTSLTSVNIGHGVTSIGDEAFIFCDSLTSVTIPDSVTEIGDYTFRSCTSLKEVYCKPTTPPSGNYSMFYDNASLRTIYVPRNSVSAYKFASGWGSYASAIVGYDF